MISLLAAAAALSVQLVSLDDFAFGCRCRLVCSACLPSWFRSWLPLPSCLPSLSPFMISLLAAAADCLLSLSPFMISLLAAAAALSPKLVSLHDFAFGCRCCLAAAALSPKLVFLHDFAFGCRCRLSLKLVSLHDFAFGCRCRLVSQACLPS